MPRSINLLPYAFSDELSLQATYFVDPSPGGKEFDPQALLGPSEDDEAPGPRIYDLTGHDRAWTKLNVGVRASLPAQEIARVLPPTSDPAADAALVVSVRCAATRLRHGVRLDPTAPGVWEGAAPIRREDVRGSLELRPLLVRRTEIPDDGADAGVARHAGAILARGPSAVLRLDAPPSFARGNLKMVWEDFRQSKNEWRREHASDIYHLEPYTEPVLYLNARYTQVRHVLDSGARTGTDAVLRDTIAALIAQAVWVQLAAAAVGGARTDEQGEYADLPQEGWKREVLAEFLPRLYPEVGADDRLRRGVGDFRDPAAVGAFMSRLGSVAQDIVGTWRLLESAVRAGEAGRDEEAVA